MTPAEPHGILLAPPPRSAPAGELLASPPIPTPALLSSGPLVLQPAPAIPFMFSTILLKQLKIPPCHLTCILRQGDPFLAGPRFVPLAFGRLLGARKPFPLGVPGGRWLAVQRGSGRSSSEAQHPTSSAPSSGSGRDFLLLSASSCPSHSSCCLLRLNSAPERGQSAEFNISHPFLRPH